jgi:hypothetical protein
MTIQELETQVLTLNAVDKAKLISILTQTLTNGSLGIKKTPGVCGGDACIGKKEDTSLVAGVRSTFRCFRWYHPRIISRSNRR